MSAPRILVIEDETPIRRFLRIAIESAGFAMLEADRGRLGIERAATESPDAIVLDLGLPDLDGKAVIAAIRRCHGTAQRITRPQDRYQGSVGGARIAVTSSVMPARRTASTPPCLAFHHCTASTTRTATSAASRIIVTNGASGSGPNICTKPCISSPSPVGRLTQLEIMVGACMAPIHPRSWPDASMAPPNTTANTPMLAAQACTKRRSGLPGIRAAHTQTRNGSATSALALMAAATVTSAIPTICRRLNVISTPDARNPIISRSLCGPPTRCTTISGFANTSQNAMGSLPPRCRTRPGSDATSSTRPIIMVSRMAITPRIRCSPVPATISFATRMNNGPYGAGVHSQNGCTFCAIASPSTPGPST